MESTPCEDIDKIVEVRTQELLYKLSWYSSCRIGGTVGKGLSKSTAEKVLMKGGVSWCNKILCSLKKLLHPLQASALPPWLVSSHEHQGKTLHQQKDYDSLEVQMMVSMFLVLCIFY